MTVALSYPHIVKIEGSPARLERMPRIRVAQIVMDYLFLGWSPDEICNQYPHLKPAEVHSAMAYYFDHQVEIEKEIEDEIKLVAEWAQAHAAVADQAAFTGSRVAAAEWGLTSMPVPLYLDVHVPRAIRDQLRRKGVDVLTAQEDSSRQLTDEELLERATRPGRVLFTQDIRFKALAEAWQQQGKLFAGLLYGHQSTALVGKFMQDLDLIPKATDPKDWENVVDHLPIK